MCLCRNDIWQLVPPVVCGVKTSRPLARSLMCYAHHKARAACIKEKEVTFPRGVFQHTARLLEEEIAGGLYSVLSALLLSGG